MDGSVNFILAKVNSSSYELTMTVDCAVFGFDQNQLKILLVKRTIEPFKDIWMLPGGALQEGMTLESTAKIVLHQLVGVDDVFMEQIKTFSEVTRHLVKRVVTTGFYALVKPENHEISPIGDDVTDVQWIPVEEVENLGFDHFEIMNCALEILKNKVEDYSIFNQLLEEKFTLKELQVLYEFIRGEEVDRRNFRRKLEKKNYIRSTKEKKAGIRGGPELYVFNPNAIE